MTQILVKHTMSCYLYQLHSNSFDCQLNGLHNHDNITLTRKAQIKTALASRAERNTQTEPTYEDITGPSPSLTAINTQRNVAYGHMPT